jgi:hypothetical protein
MNVRILKLISGEELICDVTVDEGETALMSIKEVAQVAMRSNEEGKVQVGMAPFMPYAEEPMTINVNSIALSAEFLNHSKDINLFFIFLFIYLLMC